MVWIGFDRVGTFVLATVISLDDWPVYMMGACARAQLGWYLDYGLPLSLVTWTCCSGLVPWIVAYSVDNNGSKGHWSVFLESTPLFQWVDVRAGNQVGAFGHRGLCWCARVTWTVWISAASGSYCFCNQQRTSALCRWPVTGLISRDVRHAIRLVLFFVVWKDWIDDEIS